MQIETDRLLIRSFHENDIHAYAQIVAKPEVVKFLRNSQPHSFDEAKQYIQSNIEQDKLTGIARYAVILKSNGKLIGFCGFGKVGEFTDFGWRYDSVEWGNGYGSEAALAVMAYGVRQLKLTNITVGTSVENIASVKIAQKLGLPFIKGSQVKGRNTIHYYQHAPSN